MVSDELTALIKDKFKHGKRRTEIIEELVAEGIDEEEVDKAITKIQHDALKQLPGIAWIYRKIDHFESKHSLTTPRMTALLMVGCIIFLLLFAVGLYFVFDPLGTGSTGRDVKRQADLTIIQNGLTAYYQKNQVYPQALDMLAPNYLSDLPRDPQSGSEYMYQLLNNGGDYKLCISFEQQQQQCVNAPTGNMIPIIPTDTPVPSFSPQSASGSPSKVQGL